MKKIIYLFALLVSFATAAQVKIGTNVTNLGASSSLELESTNKAFLLPRVANTAAIANPVNGMVIFDISSQCVRGYANGSWTGCNLISLAPCIKPVVGTISGTGTANIGSTVSFSIPTPSPATAAAWVITNSAGTQIDAGTGYTTTSRVYNTVDTFTVKFTVTNAAANCGQSSTTVSGTLIVDYPACATPVAGPVTASPTNVNPGNSATFTATATGTYTSVSWEVRDASNNVIYAANDNTLTTGARVYNTLGTYTATFTFTNAGVACGTKTTTVNGSLTVGPVNCALPTGTVSGSPNSYVYGTAASYSVSGSFTSAYWYLYKNGALVSQAAGATVSVPASYTAGNYQILFALTNNPGSCVASSTNVNHYFTITPNGPMRTVAGCDISDNGSDPTHFGLVHYEPGIYAILNSRYAAPGTITWTLRGTGYTTVRVKLNGGVWQNYNSNGGCEYVSFRTLPGPTSPTGTYIIENTDNGGNVTTYSGTIASYTIPPL